MNYQLIHALDFLPVADWSNLHITEHSLFRVCVELYALLSSTGKLVAKVNLELEGTRASSSRCVNMDDLLHDAELELLLMMDNAVKPDLRLNQSKMAQKMLAAQIGFLLEYTLEWEP